MDAHTEWVSKWWTDNDILWALETPSEWNWSDAKGLIIARHLWVQLQAERARVKELQDALRFYADDDHWDAGYGIAAEELAFSPIGNDWGEKAKQALYPTTVSDTPSDKEA